MGLFRRMQQLLADPNLAFLFLSLGSMAIIYELVSPGLGAGGILGAIFIVSALVGLSVLPVSAAGLLLLAVAVTLFAAELFAPGVGIAAAGGATALVLSGIFLFRETPGLRVSLAVMLPVTIVVGAGVVLAGRLVVRSRKAHSTITGEGQYLGRLLTTTRANGSRGQALVDGAWWNIRTDGKELREGEQVGVTRHEGLELLVEPTAPSE